MKRHQLMRHGAFWRRWVAIWTVSLTLALGLTVLAERKILGVMPREQLPVEVVCQLTNVDLVVACALAIVCAAFRAVGFHPVTRAGYRKWLSPTPWSAAKPLPLGSPYLTLGEAAVGLVLFVFIRFHTHTDGLIPLCALLCGYLLFTLLPLAATGRPEAALSMVSLGGAIALYPRPAIALTLLVATYAVAARGIHRSLASFPWDVDAKTGSRLHTWPFNFLSPKSTTTPRTGLLVVSAMAGWFVFCVATRLDEVQRAKPGAAFVVSLGFAYMIAAGRWVVYRINTKAPLSFLGRLATGRWLIPNFDRHAVGPLAILAVGVVMGALNEATQMPIAVKAGYTVFVTIAAGLLTPPTFHDWRLTGQFSAVRYQPPEKSARQSTAAA